ncbi:facilitated trehalose transporter Tret1 [Hyalella azteca]|uniref:Facilitated trehalose transporter Tret1 n=1 Tax=Hyalella azteca TaxID=294128 RepID=A0A8B7NSE5_HYAAZ|nr:facilitated trehalose transporter Tret1 [Hyalella azteca]
MARSFIKTPLLSTRNGRAFRRTQYFATFSASLATFSVGMIIGFSSPASYQIRNDSKHPAPLNLTNDFTMTTSHNDLIHNEALGYNDTKLYSYYNDDIMDPNLVNSHHQFNARNNTNFLLSSAELPEREVLNRDYAKSDLLNDVRMEFSNFISGKNSTESNSTNGLLTMTSNELAWFSSSTTLGAIVGGFVSSLFQNALGRRGSLLAAVIPAVMGWFLIGFGNNLGVLILGRILTGFFVGTAVIPALIYVAEVSSPDIRGFLILLADMSLSLGKLFVIVIGSVTQWQDLALIATTPVFLLCISIYFCKESPNYLINKANFEEARRSLQHFRGPDTNISQEFEDLKAYQLEATKDKLSLTVLRQRSVHIPLVIGLVLCAFVQLSGIEALTFNLASIFKQSGSHLSDYGSSIVSISFQVIGNIIGTACIENTGRRLLLVVSCVGMTISHACLGAYFFELQSAPAWTLERLFWLPLAAVMLFMLTFSVGIGPVPLVLIGEMFPPSIRETAAGLAVCVMFSTAFFVTFSFDSLQAALTLPGFYWLYAIFCILAGIFAFTCVKETKGKTLAQVAEMFGGKVPNSYIILQTPSALNGNSQHRDQNGISAQDLNLHGIENGSSARDKNFHRDQNGTLGANGNNLPRDQNGS